MFRVKQVDCIWKISGSYLNNHFERIFKITANCIIIMQVYYKKM